MGLFFKKKKSAKEETTIAAEQTTVETYEAAIAEKYPMSVEKPVAYTQPAERPNRVLLEELDDDDQPVRKVEEESAAETSTLCETVDEGKYYLLEELGDDEVANYKKIAKQEVAATAAAPKKEAIEPKQTAEMKVPVESERENKVVKTEKEPVKVKSIAIKPTGATALAETDAEMKIVPTFKGKLIQSGSEIQIYYGTLVDLFTSFQKVKVRETKKRARVYSGRTLLGYIFFKGKKLCVTLAVDPLKYAGTKYRGKDISSKKRYAATPYMVKITSERKFKYLQAVIGEMLADRQRIEVAARDYTMPYQSDEQLLENGLAVKRRIVAFKSFGAK
ncbi:MAG: hypothetical protein NC350_03985 [Corallococcus sp.]|nr:hypothetical protein [Corallococcus sp.]